MNKRLMDFWEIDDIYSEESSLHAEFGSTYTLEKVNTEISKDANFLGYIPVEIKATRNARRKNIMRFRKAGMGMSMKQIKKKSGDGGSMNGLLRVAGMVF